jgi:hypothetical protein
MTPSVISAARMPVVVKQPNRELFIKFLYRNESVSNSFSSAIAKHPFELLKNMA